MELEVNVKELIDRRALLDGWKGTFFDPVCRRIIMDAPVVDASSKKGRWSKIYKSGMIVKNGFVSSCCDMWNERKTKYCPHCGAKMN